MTTNQAYGAAATGEAGAAGPFLVQTDQTLTDDDARRWLTRPACLGRELRPGDYAMVHRDTARRWLTRPACLGRELRPGDYAMVHRDTGEIRPLRCQRNGCPDCIGVNAFRRSLAVQYVKPSHELTLTTTDLHAAAEPWPQVQDRLRVLRQAAKRDAVALGAFGTYVEQGAKSGMTHAHIVVRDGQRLDFDWLRARLVSAGFAARFTYSALRSDAEFSSYVGKSFGSYATKGYRDDAEDALRLNGGRVGHFSRGFFPVGVRRAEVESLAAWGQTTQPSPWTMRVWS